MSRKRSKAQTSWCVRAVATRVVIGFGVAAVILAEPAAAQSRFHELDRGRPTVVEDAMAIARYQLDARIGSRAFRTTGSSGYDVGVHPEVVYGSWRGGQVGVGVPVLLTGADGARARVAAIGVSALQNVTLETERSPAVAVAGGVDIPLGEGAGSGSVPWVKAIVTRTLWFGRVHLNGRYAFGTLAEERPAMVSPWATTEATRWLGGVGVDKALPLESLLLVGEVYGLGSALVESVQWHATAGLRYQPTPKLVLDVALGRTLRGEAGWSIALGMSHSSAMRSLMPRWFR